MLSRGSEWARWEPHIHAPGTIFNDQFGSDAIEAYLQSIEALSPEVSALGITDYYGLTTYQSIVAAKAQGRLPSCKLIFPNIEMRLAIGTIKGNFVNLHLLIDPSDPDHVDRANDILSRLTFHVDGEDYGCTAAHLTRLGQKLNPALRDRAALAYGSQQYKVSLDDLRKALNNRWAQENVIVAVAAGNDGSGGVRDAADTTLRKEIERFADVIFSGNPNDREFWLGERPSMSATEIIAEYGQLKPTIWGCDAHDLKTVGKPELNRYCWVKGAPTFDALRQACIEPRRAYVGEIPLSGPTPSQVISRVEIEGTTWAITPDIGLNAGLVAIIGSRGSGKTALADMIALGCDAFPSTHNKQSFLTRANADNFLHGAKVKIYWADGTDPTERNLDEPYHADWDAYPRARYLSQQFVEELCSASGMTDALLAEIERVVFEAHPFSERDGAISFSELLDLKASLYRDNRDREEQALSQLSDQIGTEMEKTKQVGGLKLQRDEKQKLIDRYSADRVKLIPKGSPELAIRLTALTTAAEGVRLHIRHLLNQSASLLSMRQEVKDYRTNRAPEALRAIKERYRVAKIRDEQWLAFILDYKGDVDALMDEREGQNRKLIEAWRGNAPKATASPDISFITQDADLTRQPLTLLEAEIKRVESILAADRVTADRLGALTKRIVEETAALESIKEKLADCEGARDRAISLTGERESAHRRVFEAICSEEKVLAELYSPLMIRLQGAGGSASKLTFSVRRHVDLSAWSRRGEELLDGRKNPFKGQGSLSEAAKSILLPAWLNGDAKANCEALVSFRTEYQDELLEASKVPRADQAYRQWSRNFAHWIFNTDHISLRYSIDYDGIDITKLSPGTRGIVLLLLYLALDTADDRPLIIDQPEENLDPKSIYSELVGLFQTAKSKRQVIIVTHNANLVVNADADQIIVADVGAHPSNSLPPISYRSGGMHEEAIRSAVCDILEGGRQAFIERSRRLRVRLQP